MTPKLPILTSVDTHSRYAPATDPRFAYRGEDAVQTLERVCEKIDYPKTIKVDNGSEFISHDLDLWADANNVTLDFSRPGKPTDNGFTEAFNSKFRAECLNAHWFHTLADAREKMEDWRGTTTRFVLTRRSHTTSRSRCRIPVASPTRHREGSRKTPPTGDPKIGLSASTQGLSVTPERTWAQVNWQTR